MPTATLTIVCSAGYLDRKAHPADPVPTNDFYYKKYTTDKTKFATQCVASPGLVNDRGVSFGEDEGLSFDVKLTVEVASLNQSPSAFDTLQKTGITVDQLLSFVKKQYPHVQFDAVFSCDHRQLQKNEIVYSRATSHLNPLYIEGRGALKKAKDYDYGSGYTKAGAAPRSGNDKYDFEKGSDNKTPGTDCCIS